ncbi:MAG: RluA family pseudouridine synthase [Roseitalea porphyridii]
MSGVEQRRIGADEAEMRLDRWFKRHFPALPHGRLSKLLRTGQVRVDGKRAQTSTRLETGQVVRVPPLGAPETAAAPPPSRPGVGRGVGREDAALIRSLVIHQDDQVIVLDKPAGLAVQGGSKVGRHIDGMLDALAPKGGERPRLVHRIDRDTSGILLLGRSAAAARALTGAFKSKTALKRYDAVVVGVPDLEEGRIDAAILRPEKGRSRVAEDEADEDAKRAVTFYRVLDRAGKRAARLALFPLTGRTHQLRVHCAAMGTPILGDGKYGGRDAFLPGAEVAAMLHLHASRIRLPHPGGGMLDVSAPLAPHIVETLGYLGLDAALPLDLPEDLAP